MWRNIEKVENKRRDVIDFFVFLFECIGFFVKAAATMLVCLGVLVLFASLIILAYAYVDGAIIVGTINVM